MATVVVRECSVNTLKYRNAVGIFAYFKYDGIVKLDSVRFHHIASDTCRSYAKHFQHKKLYLACIRGVQKNALGVTIARPASTAAHHEVRWNVSETTAAQTTALDSTKTPNITGTESSAVQNISSPVVDSLPSIGNIPEPPSIPPEVIQQLVENVGGEPTFASLGLGGWSPVGIIQNCMEFLHIGCDLPWWTSIMIGTIVVRVLMFPLVVMSQRNSARMSNYMPQIQTLQLKMTEARQIGDQMNAARYAQELMLFMKEKKLSPFRNILVPLAQAPLFLSFFMGLRGMATVPVESMRTGGLFWFTDLTVPDQYYLMPVITSLTLWITIEVGADGAKLNAGNLQTMKYVLRAFPVIILPFTINFTGAILVYWVSTNFISLLQVGFLRIPAVREFFKIEKFMVHNPDSLPVKPKGFVAGLKDSWTNMKITREIEERQRFDEIQFERAGKGSVQKTYKYDPTQPRKTVNVGKDGIIAKKRDR